MNAGAIIRHILDALAYQGERAPIVVRIRDREYNVSSVRMRGGRNPAIILEGEEVT